MSMRDKYIELAQSQLGYTEGKGNVTKYAKYFDTEAWQWFNTKKQGTPYCAIFICWLFCQLLGPDKARTFLGCPAPKNNCAAGVKYLWQYLVARGWRIDKTKGQKGDIIFFDNNGHVGTIESVSNGKYITIEGNKGNKVAKGEYAITSASISGICRPAWSEIDEQPVPSPTPTPEPAPTPTPEPQGYTGEFPKLPTRGYFKKGDKGKEVTKLQNLLMWISPGCLPRFGADGEYGNECYNAVKVCQSILKVKVDGLWGKASQNAAKAYKK